MLPLDRFDARRIALIKPSALGDIVHALPVLTALRVRYPAARISWVVNAAYEPLIRHHPDLTDTLPFDRGAFRKAPWHSAHYALAFAAELRRRQFDLVIDLQGLFRSRTHVSGDRSEPTGWIHDGPGREPLCIYG